VDDGVFDLSGVNLRGVVWIHLAEVVWFVCCRKWQRGKNTSGVAPVNVLSGTFFK
jgi:hypothetical protein